MNFKKNILSFSFVFVVIFSTNAQITLERQVLGAAGGTSGGAFSWGTVDFTVGECFITTDSSTGVTTVHTLTQGFHQPLEGDTIAVNDSLYIVAVNSPCIGANAGKITLNSDYTKWPGTVIIYVYSNQFGNTIDLYKDTLTNVPISPTIYSSGGVPVGTYYYTITIGNNPPVLDSIVITETQVPCLNFYNGITPNADNNNDTWVIEGIEFYKENLVSIFNRWGDMVWQKSNYDNDKVVWNGTNSSGRDLPDATYFYIVEISGKVYKGWVELTH